VALTVNFDGIAEELKHHRRWCLWQYRRNDNGRWTKVPLRLNGRGCSSTDPKHWHSFDEVRPAYEARRPYAGRPADGVGFQFQNSGFVGVDADHVVTWAGDTPAVEAWAREVFDRLRGAYAEFSVSNTGLHAIVPGTWGCEHNQVNFPNGQKLEVYSAGRYFTVSGHTYGVRP